MAIFHIYQFFTEMFLKNKSTFQVSILIKMDYHGSFRIVMDGFPCRGVFGNISESIQKTTVQ